MRRKAPSPAHASGRLAEFAYVGDSDIYLDAACQSLRPRPVVDALTRYYTEYNACGGRVKYAWGQRVDEAVAATRRAVLDLLGVSPRDHACSFTLNTSYGINLILQQLPRDRYARIVTSDIEHNSVFLPTMTAAQRLGVPRVVLPRAEDGALDYAPADLEQAVVVLNAASNIDGRVLTNIQQVVADAHDRGGIVIIDAAQAMAHNTAMLHHTHADAICFSAHKMYGASLGVIVARHELIDSLEISFVGGGMVSDVHDAEFVLTPGDRASRLEPGLQAWGEIIALGAAIDWLSSVRPGGQKPTDWIAALSARLFDGLQSIPGLTLVNRQAAPVISVVPDSIDAHRLAVFLSQAGVMTRSGYFCVHHYLLHERALPPLLRFSLGLHSTADDIDNAVVALGRLMKGLT